MWNCCLPSKPSFWVSLHPYRWMLRVSARDMFQCVPAKFVLSVRDCFGQNRNPNSMIVILALLNNNHGQQRRLPWRTFSALSWCFGPLLTNLPLRDPFRPTQITIYLNCLYFFQHWRPLGKRKNREAVACIFLKIKDLHAIHRSPWVGYVEP